MTHAMKTGELTFDTVELGSGLERALAETSEAVLRTIKASGLRGRGGAGFPTSLKWELAAKAEGDKKFVVCNADEGEPGTFKDRVILADYADLVFEGMTIAARVIGARQGIVYLRAEYTYLRPHLERVLQRRRQENLLGDNIAGEEGFSFDIQIHMGAGSYVCGEETALIESLEGQRGEPRNRPPFPIDTGYLDNPTIVNNVETFAWVVCIMSKGGRLVQELRHREVDRAQAVQRVGRLPPAGCLRVPAGDQRGRTARRGRRHPRPRRYRSAVRRDSAYPAANSTEQ